LSDPQLLVCTPIKLDPLINLPDPWASCVVLAMLTVSYSLSCNEMWRLYSVYLRTENCFSYALRKWRSMALGLRLSPKCKIYTACSLPRKSSGLLGGCYRLQGGLLE